MRTRGFIKWIVVILIGVFILTILRVDIRAIVNSEIGQANFTYLKELVLDVWGWLIWLWEGYLAEPVWGIINALQLPHLWEVFKEGIARGIPDISGTTN